MLKFDTYSGRERQQFLSMLNQCESQGVTDIRFVRKALQESVDGDFKNQRMSLSVEQRMEMLRRKKDQKKIEDKVSSGIDVVCPSCKTGVLVERIREGVHYLGCVRNNGYGCGYSKEIK